jgi:2-C-methyl-D-erythritol 4-phosphate cytidylyltransferase/2-C-methyl-D-erythritol 2,4-cyclodiphosphate synthase
MEKPKLLPFRKDIINSIARILEVEENQIFVKAKTGEKLGEIGNGLAVAVWATCLLYQNNQE